MKTIRMGGAQGDVLLLNEQEIKTRFRGKKYAGLRSQMESIKRAGDAQPEGLALAPPTEGKHIVAHSETGHHHFVDSAGCVMFNPETADPFTCFLRVDAEDGVDVVHGRAWDTHESLRLSKGLWMIRRQREYTPEGFRRVED